jgi:hypothetical protein
MARVNVVVEGPTEVSIARLETLPPLSDSSAALRPSPLLLPCPYAMRRLGLLALLLVAFPLALLRPADAHGQRFYERRGPWLDVGVGAGASDFIDTGVAGEAKAGLLRVRQTLAVRVAGVSDGATSAYDVGFLLGRVWRARTVAVTAMGGVATVGTTEAPGLFDSDLTLGVPLSLAVVLPLRRGFDLGLGGFANINNEDFFYGITLSAHLGP